VHTGRLRVFGREQITANPPIFPFFRTTETEDVLVVQINPVVRATTPRSAQEIMNRVNEITFNASLISEYRAIEFVTRLIDQGTLPRGTGPGQYRRINVHRIDLGFIGKRLTAASRLNNDFDFFEMLHRAGRRAARRFLDRHFDQIGVRSTIDLREEMRPERNEALPAGVDRLSG
jgi:NTE family protein